MAIVLAACGGGGDSGGGGAVVPTVTTQPTDQSVVEGGSATFSVVAAGTSPLAYQWSSSPDGTTYTAVAGATNASYATGATTLAQSGLRYRVVVSNSAGSVTSSAARLTVTATAVAPAITVQPAAVTVTAPATATFNVTATGTTPSYEWQVSTDGGTSYAAIAGAASAPVLAVTSTTTALSGYRYRVLVSNTAGNVLSAAAILTVNPTPVAPTITAQPAAQAIIAGQAAAFTVAAAGTPAPTIQWRLNGSNLVNGALAAGVCGGSTVAGATAATLTLTAVPIACTGAVFSAVASNGVAPDATSTGATLTVNPVPVPPAITVQPAAQTVLTDATATFSVTATGPGLTYQWKKNGTTIVGAVAATYTTPAVTWVDSGAIYTVVVTNVDGNVTSNAAALNLMNSADQLLASNFSAAGSYQIVWNLNYSGPETPGTNFASYDYSVTALPPLTNGPQSTTQTPRVNLTTSLPLLVSGPTRILKNGAILVVPTHDQTLRASYVGSKVRVDSLAADNTTVAYSQVRSNYSLVPLSGAVKTATPLEMAHFLNSFFSNPAILNAGINYPAGAAYLKFDSFFLGDRYAAFDCVAGTTDANVSPCVTGTTLANALTAGIVSISDGVTYHTADGAFVTAEGFSMWIATVPRPQSATLSSATQYRIYFAQNGNVYTGALTRDGEPFSGSYYVVTPGTLVFLPYSIRLNQAATQGLAAAMAL
ncbi:MAG: hypothetical protein ABI460_06930 [Caldimonas sp.]